MARCRLRLYGKKVTPDDILEEINRLLYGKGNRPFPLKPSEIGKESVLIVLLYTNTSKNYHSEETCPNYLQDV